MRAPRVLVVGDLMTDVAVQLSRPIAWGSDTRARISVRSGGSAATQAVWLAKFGLGVDFVARVGAADVERESAALARYGVTPHLSADPKFDTGRLVALVDPSGERSFLTDRGANDALSSADIPTGLLARAHHIHLSGHSFVAPGPRAAMRALISGAHGAPVSVDPGSAGFLREIGAEAFLRAIDGATMLFPNDDEAEALGGAEALARRFPLVVVKRGARGAEAFREGSCWSAPAPAAKVVDATGAGDAFAAAFLAAKLSGMETGPCLERAVAAGSAATEFLGGRPPI